jgi:hypothetical protein
MKSRRTPRCYGTWANTPSFRKFEFAESNVRTPLVPAGNAAHDFVPQETPPHINASKRQEELASKYLNPVVDWNPGEWLRHFIVLGIAIIRKNT